MFAVDASGRTVGTTGWSAEPTDVEALAPLDDDEVWVGDIGDNTGSRDSVFVAPVPGRRAGRRRPGSVVRARLPRRRPGRRVAAGAPGHRPPLHRQQGDLRRPPLRGSRRARPEAAPTGCGSSARSCRSRPTRRSSPTAGTSSYAATTAPGSTASRRWSPSRTWTCPSRSRGRGSRSPPRATCWSARRVSTPTSCGSRCPGPCETWWSRHRRPRARNRARAHRRATVRTRRRGRGRSCPRRPRPRAAPGPGSSAGFIGLGMIVVLMRSLRRR